MTDPRSTQEHNTRISPTPAIGVVDIPDARDAPSASQVAAHVAASAPRRVCCPICETPFDPRATGGRCPVCDEQVVPAAAVTRALPVLSPAWAWVKTGGWRLVLLLIFVTYQLVLLIYLWATFANAHLV